MAAPNRTPEQELEDFASGLSPQQGSVLPPATQGGLPFGAASPTPPPAPAPVSFQGAPGAAPRANLLSLGGQPAPLEQMIQQQLAAMQRYQQASYWDKFLNRGNVGTRNYEAMQQLPLLEKLASTRSQERQLQAGYLKEIGQQLKDFAALTPEQQAQQRPLLEKLLTAQSQLSGVNISPEDITHAVTSPGVAGSYGDLFTGGDFSPEEQQAAIARLGQTKPGPDREATLALIRKEKDQNLLSFIQTNAPAVIASMGGTTQKPIDMQTFLTSPQVKEQFDKSPGLKRVFNAYVNDKANAETLASWGLKPGAVDLKGMEAQARGPELTDTAKTFLAALYTGPDGKPLTPKDAKPAQIQAAIDASTSEQVRIAEAKGLQAAQLALSMPAPAEERDKHIDVNALLTEGQIVKPPQGISVGDLRTGNYRAITPAQQDKLVALAPTRQQLDTFQVLSDRLITATDAVSAFKQGVELTAGARLGTNPTARAYADSSEGFIGNLSRTLGGERGVLTDADRAVMRRAAIASFFDTQQSKDIKKAIINDMYEAAHQANLAEVAGQGKRAGEHVSNLKSLLRKLDEATNAGLVDSARAYMKTHPGEQVIRSESGQMGVIRKGTTVPKGWSVIQ